MATKRVHDEISLTTRVEKRLPMTEKNCIPPSIKNAEDHWVR